MRWKEPTVRPGETEWDYPGPHLASLVLLLQHFKSLIVRHEVGPSFDLHQPSTRPHFAANIETMSRTARWVLLEMYLCEYDMEPQDLS